MWTNYHITEAKTSLESGDYSISVSYQIAHIVHDVWAHGH